jgi:hypothetical protein
MAKKPTLTALTFRDLVLVADAETLRLALDARVRIDALIAERQAAYERISALETQIEDVIGEPGVFPFPPPPLPVAGLDPKSETLTRAAGVAKKSPPRETTAPATTPADTEAAGDEPTATDDDTDA